MVPPTKHFDPQMARNRWNLLTSKNMVNANKDTRMKKQD